MTSRAIVLGASMAGLLAAGVLAEHFEEVVVFERDRTDGDSPRKGVPQGRHANNLFARGLSVLERLLPAITDDLRRRGALVADIGSGGRWALRGHRLYPVETGALGVFARRPLLESVVRERVVAIPGVRLVLGATAEGLELSARGVDGVRVRCEGDARVETGALVVDALGRGSPVSRWLGAAGHPEPPEECIRVDVAYTTRVFTAVRGHSDHFVIVGGRPPSTRGGLAERIGDDRWLVTLFGYGGDRAPTDLPGFEAFARSLAVPDIHALVTSGAPLGDAAQLRFPANRRRRFERLRRFPAGLVVFGDALASLNPSYGMGMTSAALQAEALDQTLHESARDDVGRRFFRRAARAIDNPWELVVGADLAFASVEGPRSLGRRFGNWLLEHALPAASRDPQVARALYDVIGRAEHPGRLLSPRTAWRIFTG